MAGLCLTALCLMFAGDLIEPSYQRRITAAPPSEGILLPAPPGDRPAVQSAPALRAFGDDLLLVELASGIRVWGRSLCYEGDQVLVTVAGVLRRFPVAAVTRISIPRDSLWNGAVLGALFGGMVAPFAPCDMCRSRTLAVMMTAAHATGGGILLDALHDARRTIGPTAGLACR